MSCSSESLAYDLVVSRLGIEDEVYLGDSRQMAESRLGINGAMVRPGAFIPLLAEKGDWLRWDENPGFGGFMTARASLVLVRELARSIMGEGMLKAEVARQITAPRQAHWDEVLGRECSFGLGIFTDMRYFDLERQVSQASFGQVGLMGMSTVVIDLDSSLGVAYHLASYSGTETMNDWIRPTLISALLRR